MTSSHDLNSVKNLLDEARCLEDIFGLPADSQDAAHPIITGVHVRDRWRELAREVHPDRFEEEVAKERADAICATLNSLYDRAVAAIDAGTYGKRAPLFETSEAVIRTLKGTYQVGEVLARGDIAAIYEGRGEDGEALVIKLAREKSDNDLMVREGDALARLWRDDSPQHKHLPRLIDTFKTQEKVRGNVLTRAEGAINLTELGAHFPEGLPSKHMVWILRRALSALGWAHRQGVVHGNVCPEHILIRPEDHNVWLIDWCYACVDPARTRQGFVCVNAPYSPPEVSERKPPLPASDLYALGKTMITLLGGDAEAGDLPDSVPEKLGRLLGFMTRESPIGRAQDAWELYHTLKTIRDEIYGRHKFEVLDLPDAP